MKRMIALALSLATILALFTTGAKADGPSPAVFQVGASVKDITPTAAQGFPDGKGMWMGGFGLGAGNRRSTGVAKALKARAMVISNAAGDTLAFCINETQGMFAAYQQGPFGLDDVRLQIKAQTGIPMNHIVVGSDHSHGGPDTTGVWGGVPDVYLKYIHDQMIAAVVEAFNNRVESTINFGTGDNSTYGGDPISLPGSPEQAYVDRTVRILQAKAVADNSTVVTFVEAPFHPTTYCGSSCTLLHPSWPGVVADMAADEFGGIGIGWQGDIGRQTGESGDPIFKAAKEAVATATPVTDSTLDGRVQLIYAEVTNPVYIYFLNAAYPAGTVTCQPGLSAGGNSLCSPVGRASTPPYGAVASGWFWATSMRIGDILVSAGPGEVYPNLADTVRQSVPSARHMYLGLAQDQVGYIIGPTTSWPQVVAERDAQTSDNALFNAGPTLGDHLTCTQINSAGQMGFTVTGAPAYCPAITATDPTSTALADHYGLN